MDQHKIGIFTINATLLVLSNTTNKLKHFPIEIPNIYSICKVYSSMKYFTVELNPTEILPIDTIYIDL